MPTDQQQLRATLEQLHQQLTDVEDLNPQVREELAIAVAEIQTALLAPRQEPPDDRDLSGRLGSTMLHFEETHPTLAGTVRSIIDTLARMGI